MVRKTTEKRRLLKAKEIILQASKEEEKKSKKELKRQTRERAFIEKAKKVHNGKYDYSRVYYTDNRAKVKIICPIHGVFEQRPHDHLRGCGCQQCGIIKNTKARTYSKEEFIKRAREIHGNKYDYSKVEYVNSATKVCIICSKHGEFWQKPYCHLRGYGCPECATNKKLTKEEFIRRAKKVHGSKYDYSKVKYVNNKTKVCIICPEHGEFWQDPNSHLSGINCPKCSKSYMDQKYFIELASKKFNNKYDYSKVKYKKATEKVCIICPEHGEFWQTPNSHLNSKHGCPICGTIASHKSIMRSLDDFISEARAVHGDKYDYSKVKYINCDTKIETICPEHGPFWQTPYAHLKGCGCQKCSGHYMDTEYFIELATKKYDGKYDYSKVNYIDSQTKVCIICPEHGEFWQRPIVHLTSKYGCPTCGIIESNKAITFSLNDFIREARKVHGNKYDYSKVNYINSAIKVKIICPEHGEFEQTPASHLSSKFGCPKCAGKYMDTEYFIKKAREVHGDKYDYSKVEYINSVTPVCIICPEHGEFWQKPSGHLSGAGCSKCRESNLESQIRRQLKAGNIIAEAQKTFSWLKNKSLLFLDFYIENKKLAIECHGGQHFEPVEFFGGKKGFKETCYRDDLKNKLCKEHGIDILYFADDADYIKDYRYPVITDIDELMYQIEQHTA